MSELLNFVRYGNRYAWLMLSVLLSVVAVQAAGESRVRVNFSADWQFHHECDRLAEQQRADYIELMSKN